MQRLNEAYQVLTRLRAEYDEHRRKQTTQAPGQPPLDEASRRQAEQRRNEQALEKHRKAAEDLGCLGILLMLAVAMFGAVIFVLFAA